MALLRCVGDKNKIASLFNNGIQQVVDYRKGARHSGRLGTKVVRELPLKAHLLCVVGKLEHIYKDAFHKKKNSTVSTCFPRMTLMVVKSSAASLCFGKKLNVIPLVLSTSSSKQQLPKHSTKSCRVELQCCSESWDRRTWLSSKFHKMTAVCVKDKEKGRWDVGHHCTPSDLFVRKSLTHRVSWWLRR